MSKIILITGATDGIGYETAKSLSQAGHHLLLHGRNSEKLKAVAAEFLGRSTHGRIETYVADMSVMSDVEQLASTIAKEHEFIDVLINNAGVYKTPNPVAENGFDVRILVNTIAPYLLTKQLLPRMSVGGRVVNISSAAQAPVNENALLGNTTISDGFSAYAQSKLALIMWTRAMVAKVGKQGPVIVAINPGSLLSTKMVKEGFGTAGNDIQIGVDILSRAALSVEFDTASGRYFDNDARQFGQPHPDALDATKCAAVVDAIESALAKIRNSA